ncbi:MAG: energy-coupling factor transporter transmembrane protein EcfT [Armatimonadetes bacterium]|nr:energy-coupling factor transporter transmembrane protein EcfT [Armatimonadota bacterium]
MSVFLYVDRESPLHRLHPVTKVVGLVLGFAVALTFSHPLPALGAFVLALVGLAVGGGLANLRRTWKFLLLLFVMTTLIWSIFLRIGGPMGKGGEAKWVIKTPVPQVTVGSRKLGGGELVLVEISPVTVGYGVAMGLRIIACLVFGLTFLSCTRTEDFALGLRTLRAPAANLARAAGRVGGSGAGLPAGADAGGHGKERHRGTAGAGRRSSGGECVPTHPELHPAHHAGAGVRVAGRRHDGDGPGVAWIGRRSGTADAVAGVPRGGDGCGCAGGVGWDRGCLRAGAIGGIWDDRVWVDGAHAGPGAGAMNGAPTHGRDESRPYMTTARTAYGGSAWRSCSVRSSRDRSCWSGAGISTSSAGRRRRSWRTAMRRAWRPCSAGRAAG